MHMIKPRQNLILERHAFNFRNENQGIKRNVYALIQGEPIE